MLAQRSAAYSSKWPWFVSSHKWKQPVQGIHLPLFASCAWPPTAAYAKSILQFSSLLSFVRGFHPYSTQMWKKKRHLSIHRNSSWPVGLNIVHADKELVGHELPQSLRFQIVSNSSCCLNFKQPLVLVTEIPFVLLRRLFNLFGCFPIVMSQIVRHLFGN